MGKPAKWLTRTIGGAIGWLAVGWSSAYGDPYPTLAPRTPPTVRSTFDAPIVQTSARQQSPYDGAIKDVIITERSGPPSNSSSQPSLSAPPAQSSRTEDSSASALRALRASLAHDGIGDITPDELKVMDHNPQDMAELERALRSQAQGCQSCNEEEDEGEAYTIGIERVPIGLVEMESAHTYGKHDTLRVRLNGVYDWEFTDRLEYLWSISQQDGGKGPPLRELSVDYQDLRVGIFRGGPTLQAGVEMGLRSVDPFLNDNTVGFGDLSIQTKIVLSNQPKLKLAHYLVVDILTGNPTNGLGAGHVSMENALLATYQFTPRTYLHAQFGYWFGIGADPRVAGQMWRHGVALSTVLYDHPVKDHAILGSLEFQGWTITDGYQTNFDGSRSHLDPETVWNFYPGLRFILSEKIDIGVCAGTAMTNFRWFDNSFRIEARITMF